MNGDDGVTIDQCDRRMTAIRVEMDTGFSQVRSDIKEVLQKMEETRSEIAASAAAEAVRAACAKLDEVKARAAEKAEIVKDAADEKAARTLKDTIIEHRIEILIIAVGLLVAGDNVIAFMRGFL